MGITLRPGWPFAPLMPIYGAAVLMRRWLYDVGWLSTRAPPLPTLCVGGLEAGGSGKTPVTGWLLARLEARGARPGLLTRGFGRSPSAPSLSTRPRGGPVCPDRLGDEAAMLVAGGLDIPVAACPQRLSGARALADMDCGVIVMDDGFSHRALGRHLDVVVLRGEAPLGCGAMLPYGSLREPASGLRRAHVVWLHHKHDFQSASLAPPEDWAWRRWCPQAAVVRSCARYVLTDSSGCEIAMPRDGLLAVSGVARPQSFARALADAGAHIRRHVIFADHHRFTPADLHRLDAAMTQCEAQAWVVTEKDAVKLRQLPASRISPLVLRTRVEIVEGMAHFESLIKSVLKQ